ncbi:MAG: fibronectin type III domain-containing protein [Phycisphaeraceae bacterium]
MKRYAPFPLSTALIFAGLVLLLLTAPAGAAPRHVYLTWQGDTSRTMTVNFQTMAAVDQPVVRYSRDAAGLHREGHHETAAHSSHQIEGLADGRWIHWVELRDLEPGETYHFVAGDEKSGFSEPKRFRTLPADDSPLRFVVGGDSHPGATELQADLFRHAAAQSPQFVLFGGDFAYADGNLDEVDKWDAWFDLWAEHMVTPDGHQIPIVGAIGNHEVQGGYGQTPAQAPFYYGFFAQSGRQGYYSRTFGQLLAVHVLDTNHTTPFEGAQADWLEQQLQDYADYPYRFAMYHQPLYPSKRDYHDHHLAPGREAWAPLFDRYELTVGLEFHDHTYKRSHLIRDGEVVESDGTLYLGDGSFGRSPGEVDYPHRWYLARAGGLYHFWLVELNADSAEYRAINEQGQVFDVYPETAEGAAEAEALFRKMDKRYRLAQPLVVSEAAMIDAETFERGDAALIVNNPFDHPIQVQLAFEGAHPQLETPALEAEQLTVDAGDQQRFRVPLTARQPVAVDEVVRLPVTYRVHHAENDGHLLDRSAYLYVDRLHDVPPTPQAIVVDGQLNEWDDLPLRSHRAGKTYIRGGWAQRYDGEADGSFAFAVAHDEAFVYVAVRVVDDVVLNTWEGDERPDPRSLDHVQVDLDPRTTAQREADAPWEPLPVLIAPTQDADAEPLLRRPQTLTLPEGLQAACVRTETGYEAEIAIPMSVLEAQQAGRWQSFRLNVMVMDYDEPAVRHPWDHRTQIHWRPPWAAADNYPEAGLFRRQSQ